MAWLTEAHRLAEVSLLREPGIQTARQRMARQWRLQGQTEKWVKRARNTQGREDILRRPFSEHASRDRVQWQWAEGRGLGLGRGGCARELNTNTGGKATEWAMGQCHARPTGLPSSSSNSTVGGGPERRTFTAGTRVPGYTLIQLAQKQQYQYP